MCCKKDSIVTRCFFSPRLCSVPFFDPPSMNRMRAQKIIYNIVLNRSVTQRDQLSPQIRLISWDIFNFNQVMKQITMDHGVLPSSHLCLAKNSTTALGLHFFRQSLKTAAFITFLRARQRSQLEIYSCSYSATGEHLSLNFAKWQMDCSMAS